MTVYVERNGAGEIKGVYANLQVGYAEEGLDDDSLEVVAFRTAVAQSSDAELDKQTTLRAQVDSAAEFFAAYKALANPTANQRLQFERRVCDVLTAVLKRITQRD